MVWGAGVNKELPKGWTLAKVKDVGRVQLGRQRSPDVHAGSNMRPYLRVANVFEDRIDLDDVMEMHFEPEETPRFELRPGDILVNEGQSRELVGRPAMYRGELPGACFTNSLVRFQPSNAVDGHFALALFRNWLTSGAFQAISQITTNIAHLGAGRFGETDFPVPPVKEQRRIVAKLEALQARSRRARQALDAVPPLLEKLRQSILAAAFRGDLTRDWRAKHKDVEPASKLLERIRVERRKKWEEAELAKLKAKGKTPKGDEWKAKYKEPKPVHATELSDLPEGWCWASIEELTGLVTSGSRGWAEYYAEAGPLFIRSQDINADTLRLGEVAHVQVPASAEGARTRVRRFDLLITITGANVTRCAWVVEDPGDAYVSQHVALVRPVSGSASPFLHLWLVAETGGRKQLKKAAYGLGKPGLNLDDVATVRVPLAPAAEQIEMVTRVSQRLGVATSTDLSLKALFLGLEHLERSTLGAAFRGELVPQDPTDEPAEVMLALQGVNGANQTTKRRRTA